MANYRDYDTTQPFRADPMMHEGGSAVGRVLIALAVIALLLAAVVLWSGPTADEAATGTAPVTTQEAQPTAPAAPAAPAGD